MLLRKHKQDRLLQENLSLWSSKLFYKTEIDVEDFEMNGLTAAKFCPVCSHYTDIHESFGFCVYIKPVFVIELSTLCRVGIL